MGEEIPPLPATAVLKLNEDWASGQIDPEKWYALRKQWGKGNHGVVPENVSIFKTELDGSLRPVLECRANGDEYDGPVSGLWKKTTRVGGVLVSKQQFASGRFEIRMRIGSPDQPKPSGIIPAIWTYGFRAVRVDPELSDDFVAGAPLYHPYLQNWGKGLTVYWSEIDFPEYGKEGEFATPMYNTFLNKQHDSRTFNVNGAADGEWHTYTTDWHTELVPIPEVKDVHVAEAEGFYWVQDKVVPYDKYWGNPLKREGQDQYSVYSGKVARHWVDGKLVGENTELVPSMTGQLNLGVWLPEWAGEAPWSQTTVQFIDINVWQFDEAGDVKGIITDDIADSFDEAGVPIGVSGVERDRPRITLRQPVGQGSDNEIYSSRCNGGKGA